MFKDMFTLSGRWGRLNRLRYFGYGFLANLIFTVIVFGLFMAVMGGGMNMDFTSLGSAFLIVIPLYLVLFWVAICLMVKRLHDLNQSGWWILALFGYAFGSGFISGMLGVDNDPISSLAISLPSIAFALWLLFWPGTSGDNQYGPDPKEQT